MKRRTERTVITIETFQRTTIRSRQGAKIARCERCAAAQTPGEAAARQQIVNDVLRLAEAGEIDTLETDAARCSFCRNSLWALAQET
jgi:hypothetical protein